MSPEKEYLSPEEVAELLDVNRQLVYRLIRNGEVPSVKIGRIYRVAKSELFMYLERSKTTVAKPGGGTCANCGTSYASDLSLTQGCVECGARLCQHCWDMRGIRHCRDHATP